MSRAVMLSIRPEWCGLIASGRKTVEVRKTRPKTTTPFKCYIYCTKDPKLQFWTGPRYSYADDHSHNQFDRCGNGNVIGKFVCDWCDSFDPNKAGAMAELVFESLVPPVELLEYMGSKKTLYGWHISDLVIFDDPMELAEFRRPCENDLFCERCAMFSEYRQECGNAALHLTSPPQSWCYVEEEI